MTVEENENENEEDTFDTKNQKSIWDQIAEEDKKYHKKVFEDDVVKEVRSTQPDEKIDLEDGGQEYEVNINGLIDRKRTEKLYQIR